MIQTNIEHTSKHKIMALSNSLCVTPNIDTEKQILYLTKDKSAWITIEWLPEEIKEYSRRNYENMFSLHPTERGKVIMSGDEVNSPRWHRSYLKIPHRNISEVRSFMYSGKDFYEDLTLPSQFNIYLNYLNKNQENGQFNQVIVNWYADGNDFIAPHSDCEIGMKKGGEITIISLNENKDDFREFRITAKKNIVGSEINNIYSEIKIAALDGTIITMHGDTQEKFRHRIPRDIKIKSSRISLTFRKF